MTEYSNIQLITLILAVGIPVVGVAFNYGMVVRQSKIQQEENKVLKHNIEHLASGGVGGVTIYVPRQECEDLRELCRAEVLGMVSNHQDVMSSHSRCIRALENFARWFLTSKEGLPLSEVNKILNGGGK